MGAWDEISGDGWRWTDVSDVMGRMMGHGTTSGKLVEGEGVDAGGERREREARPEAGRDVMTLATEVVGEFKGGRGRWNQDLAWECGEGDNRGGAGNEEGLEVHRRGKSSGGEVRKGSGEDGREWGSSWRGSTTLEREELGMAGDGGGSDGGAAVRWWQRRRHKGGSGLGTAASR